MKRRVSGVLMGLFLLAALVVPARSAVADDPGGGPQSSCFQVFKACTDYCDRLENWLDRTACTLDCGVDLASCIQRALGGM
jgi:hypothetical protein